jgi:hypothetical protein
MTNQTDYFAFLSHDYPLNYVNTAALSVQVPKAIIFYVCNVRYKLECLSLVGISILIKCLRVRPLAYSRVKHPALRQALA